MLHLILADEDLLTTLGRIAALVCECMGAGQGRAASSIAFDCREH